MYDLRYKKSLREAVAYHLACGFEIVELKCNLQGLRINLGAKLDLIKFQNQFSMQCPRKADF